MFFLVLKNNSMRRQISPLKLQLIYRGGSIGRHLQPRANPQSQIIPAAEYNEDASLHPPPLCDPVQYRLRLKPYRSPRPPPTHPALPPNPPRAPQEARSRNAHSRRLIREERVSRSPEHGKPAAYCTLPRPRQSIWFVVRDGGV